MDIPEVDRLSLVQKLEHFWTPVRRPAPSDLRIPRNPPMTDEDVRWFERSHGIRLPANLVRLLRVQNGGYPRWTLHPQINGRFETVRGLVRQGGLKVDWKEELEYMREESIREPSGLQRMIGLTGGGHYDVCLDYGRGSPSEPVVTFVDLERFEPAVVLAKSFDEFVVALRYDANDTVWALAHSGPPEAVARALGAALGRPFEPRPLSKYQCPDDVPGYVATFPDEPPIYDRPPEVHVAPNLQSDGVSLIPWRAATEWLVTPNAPDDLARRFEARMSSAGLPCVWQCSPRD